jgi:hypothetical protein
MKPPIISLARNSQPIRSVHVFGQRNSGTNYLNSLIANNLMTQDDHKSLYDPRNTRHFGWKHGFPTMSAAPDDVLAVVVYRDPIAWLQSLHRLPWHAIPSLHNLSFSDFIRAEWIAVIDDLGFGVTPDNPLWGTELLAERDPKTRNRFANAIRMRNAKIASFSTLHTKFENCLYVRYEDVVENPKGLLRYLSSVYGLAGKSRFDSVLYDRGTKSRGVFAPRPIDPINSADMEFIREELDQSQEKRLGYELAKAPLAPEPRLLANMTGEIDMSQMKQTNMDQIQNLSRQNIALVSSNTRVSHR